MSRDDWGGFYDHVVPPNVDANGYGLPRPPLILSVNPPLGPASKPGG